MAEPKTKANEAPMAAFLESLANAQVRRDCWTLVDLMPTATRARPRMWGTAIVGFGMDGFDQYGALLGKLGAHACGKSCLYIKRLADVDVAMLGKLVPASVRERIRTSARPRRDAL